MKRFDFTTPTYTDVNQVFVTGPGAPPLRSLDGLAGQTVHVRRSKSFYDHLLELNARFEHPDPARSPLPPMRIELLPDELETEEVLEMVNDGLVRIALSEEWLADIWARYLPDVTVRRARRGAHARTGDRSRPSGSPRTAQGRASGFGA